MGTRFVSKQVISLSHNIEINCDTTTTETYGNHKRLAARPPTDIHLTFVAACVRDSWEALVLSHCLELFSVPHASGVMTRVLGGHKVRNTLFDLFGCLETSWEYVGIGDLNIENIQALL